MQHAVCCSFSWISFGKISNIELILDDHSESLTVLCLTFKILLQISKLLAACLTHLTYLGRTILLDGQIIELSRYMHMPISAVTETSLDAWGSNSGSNSKEKPLFWLQTLTSLLLNSALEHILWYLDVSKPQKTLLPAKTVLPTSWSVTGSIKAIWHGHNSVSNTAFFTQKQRANCSSASS